MTSVASFLKMPGNPQGVTPLGYFRVGYDKNQGSSENGLATAQNFYPVADGIYTYLSQFFPGVTLPGAPMQLLFSNVGVGAGLGASWSGTQIWIRPNANVQQLQWSLVEELSEMFMAQYGKGWFAGVPSCGKKTEGEVGEGLSIFLGREWALANGYTPSTFGNTWMTSSRSDTLDAVDVKPDYGVKTSGDVLFLTFLKYQLNFTTNEIIAHGDASSTMSGLYRNLTGDNTNPYYFFKSLLDYKYPNNSAIPNGTDADCPWPIAKVNITFHQNSYSKDDVTRQLGSKAGLYPDEFSIDVDGFNLRTVNDLSTGFSNTNIKLTLDPFPDISGFPPAAVESPSTNTSVPQTISYHYSIQFTSTADFPATGTSAYKKLEADFSLLQKPQASGSYAADPAFANIILTSGSDPRFQNVVEISVSPSLDNDFYLSNDLRVLTITPGLTPIPQNLTFSDPYQYLKDLLSQLNGNYNDPSKSSDPFTGALDLFPQPSDALTNYSSIAPYTYDENEQQWPNYNYAIARVRLTGAKGDAASAVQVFFRAWQASSPDNWYDTTNNYPTTTSPGGIAYPVPAPDNSNFPVWGTTGPAAGNLDPEFGSGGLNIHDFTVPDGGERWMYYGCYLDFFSDPSPYPPLVGDHHCIIAQINYPPSPITNANGIWSTPQNNDKLAQRNIAFGGAGNPVEQTQIVPTVFDTTPTAVTSVATSSALQTPDELAFNWGTVPVGSTVSLYWPGVNAVDVLALANARYAYHTLSALDTNTLSLSIPASGKSYIPVPASAGEKFAGLIAVNLPNTIAKGMEFAVAVQRITTVGFTPQIIPVPPVPKIAHLPPHSQLAGPARSASATTGAVVLADASNTYYWRQVLGSFSLRILVVPHASLLPQEYDALAILRWRLSQMPPTNRWYPVLSRLVDIVAGRVEGAGGDPGLVPPGGSPKGAPPSVTTGGTSGTGCNSGCCCCCCRRGGHVKPPPPPPPPSSRCGHEKRRGGKCSCGNSGWEKEDPCKHSPCERHRHQHHECKAGKPRRLHDCRGREVIEICGAVCEQLFDRDGLCCGFVLLTDCCDSELRFDLCGRCHDGLVRRFAEVLDKGVIAVLVDAGTGDIEGIGCKSGK